LSVSRLLKTPGFARWQKKMALADTALHQAVREMQLGLIDADLGGDLVKKRVPRPGAGKSSGYRTILATNKYDRWIFLYGFAKNEKDNIDPQELLAFKLMAKKLLPLPAKALQTAIDQGALKEIPDGEIPDPPGNA